MATIKLGMSLDKEFALEAEVRALNAIDDVLVLRAVAETALRQMVHHQNISRQALDQLGVAEDLLRQQGLMEPTMDFQALAPQLGPFMPPG
jgi:hypothetical protein